jgi:hypothetical protein
MTRAQRQLRMKWALAALVFCLILIFDDYVEKNAGWLRWIALFAVLAAMAGESRSRSEMRAESSVALAELIESAPWLKAWFAFWAIACFAGAIYATRNSIDLFSLVGGIRFLLLSFAVLVGPIVVLMQRRRFKELGKVGNAI